MSYHKATKNLHKHQILTAIEAFRSDELDDLDTETG